MVPTVSRVLAAAVAALLLVLGAPPPPGAPAGAGAPHSAGPPADAAEGAAAHERPPWFGFLVGPRGHGLLVQADQGAAALPAAKGGPRDLPDGYAPDRPVLPDLGGSWRSAAPPARLDPHGESEASELPLGRAPPGAPQGRTAA
ncbi:hypothetical protein [Nocardiopsis potens]|uniref:hypothetical protein n=1 Tax=Nocardiopsis potens TaxID=1246458 RepID=UPI000345F8E6|nr:hypothetical protein [Nocardiopsis potens]